MLDAHTFSPALIMKVNPKLPNRHFQLYSLNTQPFKKVDAGTFIWATGSQLLAIFVLWFGTHCTAITIFVHALLVIAWRNGAGMISCLDFDARFGERARSVRGYRTDWPSWIVYLVPNKIAGNLKWRAVELAARRKRNVQPRSILELYGEKMMGQVG